MSRILSHLVGPRIVRLAASLVLGASFLTGCSSSSAPAEDGVDQSAASELTRGDAIGRAEQWVGAQLLYRQSANHARDFDSSCSAVCERTDNAAWDAYRSDCSGLVSWAWGLPAPGRTTYGFAPFDTSVTQEIAASDLQPGDAVNNDEHVMLFKNWAGPGVATFIEEPGCSSSTPYAHEFTSSVSISGSIIHVSYNGMTFHAIRFDGIQEGGATASQPAPPAYTGVAHDASGRGYWIAGSDGGVFTYGDAAFHGSMGGKALSAPIIGIAATPSGGGYWLAGADGGLFSFGDAAFFGSMGGKPLNAPIVGIAATPTGGGYWLAASDGGLFAFGDAAFYGSMGGKGLNAPVVGIARTPSGKGYWLAASDGGLFAFGDAGFYGSMGGKSLNGPVVGVIATASGNGYWLVVSDGGMFSFGDAAFYGSMGDTKLNSAVVGASATPDGRGYWLLGGDGGMFTFGDAGFFGSRG